MSGHSKWSTIKRAKGANDAKRGQLFTKFAKEIIIAAGQGGSSVDTNFRLRMAIQRARDHNMPNDNIERAIKRGSGEGSEHQQMLEVTYEGYGPGGTAILLQALTDNKNRTVSDVRATFTKTGANMAEAGAVAWQFEPKGVIVVDADPDQAEETALLAIDAGADDFETEDSTLHAYTAPQRLEEVRKILADSGASIRSSELSMMPKSTVPLDERTSIRTLKLLDQLEELDDIQRVFSNADFPDEALARYAAEE
jgi:YebC/PmpR family DNA-binding regulatory protein